MQKQWCSLWLCCGAALLVPALAHAQDDPKPYPECTKAPTDAETAAAKGAYQAGNASFDEADYPRAITYWEDAYRRDCTANLLLKNLARAYELFGERRHAVVALETFLVREPASADKEQIQRRIEVLKKQITPEKAPPEAARPEPAIAPPQEPAKAALRPTPAAEGEHSGKRPILPLFVAGGGAVILIVGAGVYGSAAKDVSHYETLCANHNCGTGQQATDNAAAANRARSRKIAGGAIAGIGGATLVGGLIWYFASPRGGGAIAAASAGRLTKPQIDPALAPGFAGLALSGAF